MPEKAWKRTERRIARQLGGERTPLSGPGSRHTAADVIGVPEYVEIKRRRQDTTHGSLVELEERARRQDRRPAIVYELQGQGLRALVWAAVWFEDYLDHRSPSGEGSWWHRADVGAHGPWMIEHEVARQQPNGTLVRDTVQSAREEDGGRPLVVVSVHHSSRQAALVPLVEGW